MYYRNPIKIMCTRAPPYTRKLREQKNIEIYPLYKHTDCGYHKIAKSTGVEMQLYAIWLNLQW
jgi:hypothetical protein